MAVEVLLHKTHRQYTGGRESIPVQGRTVGECLKDLIDQYPSLAKELFDSHGKLNALIEVYLNGVSTYPNELVQPVKDGDYFLAGG